MLASAAGGGDPRAHSGDPPGERHLYPRLLLAAWDDLHPDLRQLHRHGASARGRFRVHHGRGRIARILARVARLPAATDAMDVQLCVAAEGGRERWSRRFDARPLTSVQWQRDDGLLAEQWGPLELAFRLEVASGALVYHPAGAALRLGPFRVQLPSFLAPRVAAREQAGDGCGQARVAVEVRLPLIGLLLAYEGSVTPVEGSA
jgi:hypothetical protein